MTGKQPKRKPRPGVDVYGRIPLHYASLIGDVEAIKQAIQAGIDINTQDDNGYTPLRFAVQEFKVEVVKLLLDAGANPNLYDRHGNGPLWEAIGNSGLGTEILELLLSAGADPDKVNNYGKSPRSLALEIRHGLEKYFT